MFYLGLGWCSVVVVISVSLEAGGVLLRADWTATFRTVTKTAFWDRFNKLISFSILDVKKRNSNKNSLV